MPIYYVYHRKELPDPLQTEEEVASEWPDVYRLVADVKATSVEDACRLTNTIDRAWWENSGVKPKASPPIRSTSVGDVIITPRGPMLCCAVGWQDVWKLRGARRQERGPTPTIIVQIEGGRITAAYTDASIAPDLICVDRDTDGLPPSEVAHVGGREAALRRENVDPAEDFPEFVGDVLSALKG